MSAATGLEGCEGPSQGMSIVDPQGTRASDRREQTEAAEVA